MIVLYFGWLLERAYGLMTCATQRSASMGIHWAFIGTFLGTAALTCIAHPCSDTYEVHLLVNKYVSYAALAAGSIVGSDGRRCSMGEVMS
jgi:hypothetical protein